MMPTTIRSAVVAAGTGFNSTPQSIPGVHNLQTIIGYAAWIATGVCIIGLIVVGARMAISHRRGDSEHMGALGGVVAACIVIGSASSVVGSLLGFSLFTSTPQAIPGLSAVQQIIGYTAWVAAAVCLLGLLIVGARMAISHRRGDSEAFGMLGSVAAGCVVVGGAATLVGAFI